MNTEAIRPQGAAVRLTPTKAREAARTRKAREKRSKRESRRVERQARSAVRSYAALRGEGATGKEALHVMETEFGLDRAGALQVAHDAKELRWRRQLEDERLTYRQARRDGLTHAAAVALVVERFEADAAAVERHVASDLWYIGYLNARRNKTVKPTSER